MNKRKCLIIFIIILVVFVFSWSIKDRFNNKKDNLIAENNFENEVEKIDFDDEKSDLIVENNENSVTENKVIEKEKEKEKDNIEIPKELNIPKSEIKKESNKVQNKVKSVVNEKKQKDIIANPEIKDEPKKDEIKVEQKQEPIINKPTEKPKEDPNKNNCAIGKHKVGIGNSNKWFNSQQDAVAEYKRLINYWGAKWESFEIDDNTYEKNCPSGYETYSCPYCGKWTINYYFN